MSNELFCLNCLAFDPEFWYRYDYWSVAPISWDSVAVVVCTHPLVTPLAIVGIVTRDKISGSAKRKTSSTGDENGYGMSLHRP